MVFDVIDLNYNNLQHRKFQRRGEGNTKSKNHIMENILLDMPRQNCTVPGKGQKQEPLRREGGGWLRAGH